jgi:hypothetical protein
MPIKKESLGQLIVRCRYERNVDDQVSLLIKINANLPKRNRLRIPSLITDDYISRALDMIEERVFGAPIY